VPESASSNYLVYQQLGGQPENSSWKTLRDALFETGRRRKIHTVGLAAAWGCSEHLVRELKEALDRACDQSAAFPASGPKINAEDIRNPCIAYLHVWMIAQEIHRLNEKTPNVEKLPIPNDLPKLDELIAQQQTRAIELILRDLVTRAHGGSEAVETFLKEKFGSKIYAEWMRRARSGPLSGLTFEELRVLITVKDEYDAHYRDIFESSDTLTLLGERIRTLERFLFETRMFRNYQAHHNPLRGTHEALLAAYYEEIVTPIEAEFNAGRIETNPECFLGGSKADLAAYFDNVKKSEEKVDDLILQGERTYRHVEDIRKDIRVQGGYIRLALAGIAALLFLGGGTWYTLQHIMGSASQIETRTTKIEAGTKQIAERTKRISADTRSIRMGLGADIPIQVPINAADFLHNAGIALRQDNMSAAKIDYLKYISDGGNDIDVMDTIAHLLVTIDGRKKADIEIDDALTGRKTEAIKYLLALTQTVGHRQAALNAITANNTGFFPAYYQLALLHTCDNTSFITNEQLREQRKYISDFRRAWNLPHKLHFSDANKEDNMNIIMHTDWNMLTRTGASRLVSDLVINEKWQEYDSGPHVIIAISSTEPISNLQVDGLRSGEQLTFTGNKFPSRRCMGTAAPAAPLTTKPILVANLFMGVNPDNLPTLKISWRNQTGLEHSMNYKVKILSNFKHEYIKTADNSYVCSIRWEGISLYEARKVVRCIGPQNGAATALRYSFNDGPWAEMRPLSQGSAFKCAPYTGVEARKFQQDYVTEGGDKSPKETAEFDCILDSSFGGNQIMNVTLDGGSPSLTEIAIPRGTKKVSLQFLYNYGLSGKMRILEVNKK
jgi:hypothetical protein